jgi:23S rRNA pseudouridine2605 synthase
LNPQQLQIARAALWRQNAAGSPAAENSGAPLLTTDDAASWLGDIGLCLFLPRHTQLPAPAPSFVEACLGASGVTPPPAAISTATELAARLIADDRAIPLNLLGTHSEQPDFLTTPEVLPWVAAIRGDRQWKAAPGGRTAPLILRTWEALDREGTATAVELREFLGRELTEAAVLRALISLWTGLRAMPVPAPGEPTRWTLLKHRFPAQLATGANTSQATALSALLSLYLHSAVAASPEEAELFLSPLTSRSRIREVLHGMMAARQFVTMSVGSQTLLFVEGSLPETAAPEAETAVQSTPPATPASSDRLRPWRNDRRPPGSPFPREDRGKRRPFVSARGNEPRRDRQRPDQARPDPVHPDQARPDQIRPDPARHDQAARGGSQRPGKKPWQRSEGRPDKKGSRPPRPWQRSEAGAESSTSPRPWQRREAAPRKSDSRPPRPGQRAQSGRSDSKRPWQRREAGPQQSGSRPPRPWQKRPGDSDRRESRASANRPSGENFRPKFREDRPWRKSEARAGRPWQDRERPRRENRPDGASTERRERGDRDRPDRNRQDRNRRPESPNRPPRNFQPGADRRPRSFNPAAGENRRGKRPGRSSNRPGFSGDRPARPESSSKKFVKKRFPRENSSPGKPKPRKNRNQEETPE